MNNIFSLRCNFIRDHLDNGCDQENKKKIIHHERNEDKAVDYEFWQLIYSKSKDLK